LEQAQLAKKKKNNNHEEHKGAQRKGAFLHLRAPFVLRNCLVINTNKQSHKNLKIFSTALRR
jgi:hypothetical protein